MARPDFASMLVDSSRQIADLVVEQVQKNPEHMEELYQIAIQRNDQIAMRAARAFDLVDEKYRGMAEPYLMRIRQNLLEIPHQSVQRCFLRTLSRYPIPEEDEELGRFYEMCLQLMLDTKLPVAIRYYGMVISFEVACKLPDLRFELIPLYDELALENSTGLRGRAKHYKNLLIKKFGIE